MSETGVIHNFSEQALGVRFSIRIAGEDFAFAERAAESVFFTLQRLQSELETVATLNQLPVGAMTSVGDDFLVLWKFSQQFKKETHGHFDITAGALFNYWKERNSTEFNPDDANWERIMESQKQNLFSVEGNEITRHDPTGLLDFSAVIHGYALDKVAELLESNWGIHRALLTAGGNAVLALDPPGEASGWRLGLGQSFELKLCRTALASKVSGSIGSVLIDPLTGQPARLNQTVRALATTALEAEALATVATLLTTSDFDTCVSAVSTRGVWLPHGEFFGAFRDIDWVSRT